MNIYDTVVHQLSTNQFFSGGAVLMLAGGIWAYCRSMPRHVWQWVRRRIVLELEFADNDQSFQWMVRWLANQSYTQNRARCLSVATSSKDSSEYEPYAKLAFSTGKPDGRPKIVLSPAVGQHTMWYKNRLMILSRSRNENAETDSGRRAINEKLKVYLFTTNRDMARQLVEEARELSCPEDDDRIQLHRWASNYWEPYTRRQPRPLGSVVLEEGLLDGLVSDVLKFQQSRQWYVDRGIPYRRGYMLQGPPGTGKSSAVLAIASELKMGIAVLDLSHSSMSDEKLSASMAQVPDNCIVLIEDVDCAFKEREGKKMGVTFSGLLNAIDGVSAAEGRVLFVTTNHIDLLDAALIRPGRIDRIENIDHANADQGRRMFLRFFGDEAMAIQFGRLVEEQGKVSTAAIQSHLIKYSLCPKEAVDMFNDILRGDVIVERTAMPQPVFPQYEKDESGHWRDAGTETNDSGDIWIGLEEGE